MHTSRYHKNLHEEVQPRFCVRLTTSSDESTGASGVVKIDVLGTAFQSEVVEKIQRTPDFIKFYSSEFLIQAIYSYYRGEGRG